MGLGDEELSSGNQLPVAGAIKSSEIVKVVETSEQIAAKIDSCRETVLQREFGPKFPQDRINTAVAGVRALLDSAPDKPSLLYSHPVRKVELAVPVINGPGQDELVRVTLKREYQPGSRDEIRITRRANAPIIEIDSDGRPRLSETRTHSKDEDLGFMMIGISTENTPVIWKNLFQENALENDRVNIDFFIECGNNGIKSEQMSALTEEQREKMGIFSSDNKASLAESELRQGSDEDRVSLALLESALKAAEQTKVKVG